MPLFNVIGSDGNIYLHVAATSGADIVCVCGKPEDCLG